MWRWFKRGQTSSGNRCASSSQGRDRILTREQIGRLLNADMKDVWLADSGASRHITYRREWFSEIHTSEGESIALGEDDTDEINGSGTII